MKKRSMRLALCLALALALMAGAPAAAAAWDDPGTNTLTFKLIDEYQTDLTAKPETEGEAAASLLKVDLYLVATPQDVPGYDAYTFTQDSFSETFRSLTMPSMEGITNEVWMDLAQQAAKLVAAAPGDAPIEPDQTLDLGQKAEGVVPGLYLALAHGADMKFPAYFVTAGEDVTTVAASDDYVYTFQPVLVSIPEQVTEPVAGLDPTDPTAVRDVFNGEWEHEVETTLKPTRQDRNGQLRIVKGIDEYDLDEPATFVFHVTATKGTDEAGNPVTVYDNIFSLTFDSSTPTTQEILVEDIPTGAQVRVEEVYSGAAYELSSARVQGGVIPVEDVLAVSFTNRHDFDRKQGHGVLNRFSFSGGDAWEWQQVLPGTYPPAETPGA